MLALNLLARKCVSHDRVPLSVGIAHHDAATKLTQLPISAPLALLLYMTDMQCMQGFIHSPDRAAETASMQHHVLGVLSIATQADERRTLAAKKARREEALRR